jgi:hypothetical protein
MAKDNLKQATKKSIYANNVDKLDSFGVGKDTVEMADVLTAMESDVAAFIERVHDNINKTDMVTTGNIADLRIQSDEANGTINIVGNSEHILYIDSGVRGAESDEKAPDSPFAYTDKMPPASAFYQWIDRKNINLRNEEYYGGDPSSFEDYNEEKAKLGLSWALAKSIYKKGIKPQPVFKKEIPQLVEDLQKTLGEFSMEMLTSSIRNQYGTDIYKKSVGK